MVYVIVRCSCISAEYDLSGMRRLNGKSHQSHACFCLS